MNEKKKSLEPALDSDAKSLLVVDDDRVFRGVLGAAFERRGYRVRYAANAEEAQALASEESPEFATVDLRMPGEGGLWVLKMLKEIDPHTNVVVLTGYGSIATALEAVRLGATHYLTKPVDADQVETAFAREQDQTFVQGEASQGTVPSLARLEWEHIQRVMMDVNGNISQAARMLGLHRRSLQRKLGKMPVKR